MNNNKENNMNFEPINGIALEISYLNYGGEENPLDYILSLKEKNGNRAFNMIINTFDAQLIALTLEKVELPSPLVYDIFNKFIDDYKLSISSVIITAISDGIFYAEIHLNNGKVYSCRPTDGIVFALKNNINVSIDETVLEEVAYDINEVKIPTILKRKTPKKIQKQIIDENLLSNLIKEADYDGAEIARLELIDNYTNEMNNAVDLEEYEKAGIFRDKITGLKKLKIFND